MNVFEAFSSAVVSGKWKLCILQRATEIGDVATETASLDVIEHVAQSKFSGGTSADGLKTETLLYINHEQLPTIDAGKLIAGYILKDTTTGNYYSIDAVSIGKNQDDGSIEHVEFTIAEKEATNG